MAFGESDLSKNRLELEMHPENGRTIFYKLLILFLGTFIVFPLVTGMTIYVFFESKYMIHATVTIGLLTYVAIIYWGINNAKSVYQVDISPSGFSMFATKVSPFMTPVNGFYAWGDIVSYTSDSIDDDPLRCRLILNLNTGQSWTFYYLGFKKSGDLPIFYRKLLSQLPEKERKSKI